MKRLTLALTGLLMLAACHAKAATLTVAPEDMSPLATAAAGDVVKLAPGRYVGLRLGATTPAGITLDASAEDAADLPLVVLVDAQISDVQGLKIKGGRWQSACPTLPCYGYALRAYRMTDFTVDGALFVGPEESRPGVLGVAADGYGLGVTDSAGVVVVNSHFTGFKSSLMLTNVDGYRVQNNRLSRMRADGVLAMGTRNGQIVGNYCDGGRITGTEHPDCVQLGNRPTMHPTTNVRIAGNLMVSDMQGIFFDSDARLTPKGTRLWTGEVLAVARTLDDGPYDGVVIEDNLMVGSFPQGIGAFDTKDALVRNNEVRTLPGSRYFTNFQATGVNLTRCGNRALPANGKKGIADAPCPAAGQ